MARVESCLSAEVLLFYYQDVFCVSVTLYSSFFIYLMNRYPAASITISSKNTKFSWMHYFCYLVHNIREFTLSIILLYHVSTLSDVVYPYCTMFIFSVWAVLQLSLSSVRYSSLTPTQQRDKIKQQTTWEYLTRT